jgi:ferric-dicitrate binding protein FerR (iron transport regulator)
VDGNGRHPAREAPNERARRRRARNRALLIVLLALAALFYAITIVKMTTHG